MSTGGNTNSEDNTNNAGDTNNASNTNNPLTAALRLVFGPLVARSAPLPAVLAYGVAVLVAALLIILLRSTLPDNLMWIFVFAVAVVLVAFVYTDHDERRSGMLLLSRPVIRGNILFEDGTPVEGASVFVGGVNTKALTNELGSFALDVFASDSWTVRISYQGQSSSQEVLKRDVQKPVTLTLKGPPPKPPPVLAYRNRLPGLPSSPLFGREADLKEVVTKLRRAPWVAGIVGDPGVGKTALAWAAARVFASTLEERAVLGGTAELPTNAAILWYDVAEQKPDGLLLDLARDLQVDEPARIDWHTVRRRLEEFPLHQLSLPLLVLNNLAETPTDDARWTEVVRILGFAKCPILWTSRTRYDGLADINPPYELDSLDETAALACFGSRMQPGAREIWEDKNKPADRGCVTDVVNNVLGRLPLALELAAATVPRNSDEWKAWCEGVSQFPALDEITKKTDRSILAAFTTSYNSLDKEQKDLFTLLGLFPSEFGFSYDSVAAALNTQVNAITVAAKLGELVDRALVHEVPYASRASLHPLLQLYAAHLLEVSPELKRIGRSRLIQYYRTYTLNHKSGSNRDLDAIGSAWALLRVICDWATQAADEQATADLAEGIANFLVIRGYWQPEWDDFLLKGSVIFDRRGELARQAFLLNQRATIALGHARWDDASKLFSNSLEVAEAAGDNAAQIQALYKLGIIAINQSEFPKGSDYLQKGLSLCQMGDSLARVPILHELGRLELDRGCYNEAEGYLREAEELERGIGDQEAIWLGNTLYELGRLALTRNRFDDAENYFNQSSEQQRITGARVSLAIVDYQLAVTAFRKGDYPRARQLLTSSLASFMELDDKLRIAQVYEYLGRLELNQGDYQQARSNFTKSLEGRCEVRDRRGWAIIALEIGNMASAGRWRLAPNDVGHDDFAVACLYWTAAYRVLEPIGLDDKLLEVLETKEHMARCAAQQDYQRQKADGTLDESIRKLCSNVL